MSSTGPPEIVTGSADTPLAVIAPRNPRDWPELLSPVIFASSAEALPICKYRNLETPAKGVWWRLSSLYDNDDDESVSRPTQPPGPDVVPLTTGPQINKPQSPPVRFSNSQGTEDQQRQLITPARGQKTHVTFRGSIWLTARHLPEMPRPDYPLSFTAHGGRGGKCAGSALHSRSRLLNHRVAEWSQSSFGWSSYDFTSSHEGSARRLVSAMLHKRAPFATRTDSGLRGVFPVYSRHTYDKFAVGAERVIQVTEQHKHGGKRLAGDGTHEAGGRFGEKDETVTNGSDKTYNHPDTAVMSATVGGVFPFPRHEKFETTRDERQHWEVTEGKGGDTSPKDPFGDFLRPFGQSVRAGRNTSLVVQAVPDVPPGGRRPVMSPEGRQCWQARQSACLLSAPHGRPTAEQWRADWGTTESARLLRWNALWTETGHAGKKSCDRRALRICEIAAVAPDIDKVSVVSWLGVGNRDCCHSRRPKDEVATGLVLVGFRIPLRTTEELYQQTRSGDHSKRFILTERAIPGIFFYPWFSDTDSEALWNWPRGLRTAREKLQRTGSLANNYQYQLYADQPNVCPYQEVAMVGHREPCVRAFTRTVKVWKPNCGSYQDWCVGYERRTAYYTAYRQVYRSTYQTNYRCCQGYQQLNREPGCMYPALPFRLSSRA
ncbi:hypothetical protein Bbelb_336330 [Branchiostoma belcheri]|nr:hypothetical protein Bbelb_336330 [Branchiostoma belcheri]